MFRLVDLLLQLGSYDTCPSFYVSNTGVIPDQQFLPESVFFYTLLIRHSKKKSKIKIKINLKQLLHTILPDL